MRDHYEYIHNMLFQISTGFIVPHLNSIRPLLLVMGAHLSLLCNYSNKSRADAGPELMQIKCYSG
jgi:hypothetical protein